MATPTPSTIKDARLMNDRAGVPMKIEKISIKNYSLSAGLEIVLEVYFIVKT